MMYFLCPAIALELVLSQRPMFGDSKVFDVMCILLLSRSNSETPWAVTCQAPLSMGFPKQEYWGGLPFPTPGDLPDPWIKPTSPVAPALQADSLLLSHQGGPDLSLIIH